MLPVALRPAPGEGISARLGIPQVVKVPQGAPMGKDVEEAQELPVNPPRGRHGTGQKGVSSAHEIGAYLKNCLRVSRTNRNSLARVLATSSVCSTAIEGLVHC